MLLHWPVMDLVRLQRPELEFSAPFVSGIYSPQVAGQSLIEVFYSVG